MFLLIWGVYECPQEKDRYVPYISGQYFRTLALVGVSIAFSAFIGSASVKYFSLVYGCACIHHTVLMMWLYTSSTVIYCGMALNLTIRETLPEPRIKKDRGDGTGIRKFRERQMRQKGWNY